jgi:membrane associated rhomboid family serine protease
MWTMFTSAFLHADILHLLGNMWFLWIFGPAVEDRLGILLFLLVYFATGIAGDCTQALLDVAFNGTNLPIIGASACIMGVAGAYWFAFPWSTVCVFYLIIFFIRFWYGVWEIAALWVIGAYLALDLWDGLVSGATHAGGGVASFAHVGAGVAGVLMALLLHVKRDTESLSEAKAVHADTKDLDNMPFYALERMLEAEPDNIDVLRAIVGPAIRQGQQHVVADAVKRMGPSLITKDPYIVYSYLMDIHGDPAAYQSVHLLRLAGQFERLGNHDKAINVYKMIVETRQAEMEAENALYRMAYCYWTAYQHKDSVRTCLAELQRRFPRGEMMPFAASLWKQVQAQQPDAR